jgi:tRNA dimethylallyltransferase
MNRKPGGLPVIVIVGPTGVGKTDVALAVAKRIKGEVISADSRQVYRELRIGTAKPLGEWSESKGGRRYIVQGVVHHLIDHVDPIETYTAGRFRREAIVVLNELNQRQVPVVVVGGTGMYIRSLVRGLAVLPEGDPTLRKELAARAEVEGRAILHQELRRVDPVAAQTIPPNNIHRVIRALEVHRMTGKPLTVLQKEGTHPFPLDFVWFGLRLDPLIYQERLKHRCEAMGEGILAETRLLLRKGTPPTAPAFQSLGYREAVAYESGRMSRAEFEQELFKQTRLYAKRQLTWFRAEPAIQWLAGIPLVEGNGRSEVAKRILSSL